MRFSCAFEAARAGRAHRRSRRRSLLYQYREHEGGERQYTMPADSDAWMAASPLRPPRSVLLPPVLRFADQAAIGIVNVTTDRSGTPSSIPMLFRTVVSTPYRGRGER